LHDIKNEFFVLEQELRLAGRWLMKMQSTLKAVEELFYKAIEEVGNGKDIELPEGKPLSDSQSG